jgi:hypothetical protein
MSLCYEMALTHFMPYWPKEDKCFEDEQVEVVDSAFGKKLMKNGN